MTEIKKVNIDPIAKSYRILFCPGYPLSDIKGFGRLGFIISNLVFGAYKITNRPVLQQRGTPEAIMTLQPFRPDHDRVRTTAVQAV